MYVCILCMSVCILYIPMTSYTKGTDWGVYLIRRGITDRKRPLRISPRLPC